MGPAPRIITDGKGLCLRERTSRVLRNSPMSVGIWVTLFTAGVLACGAGKAPGQAPQEFEGGGRILQLTPQGIAVASDTGERFLAEITARRLHHGIQYRGIPEPTFEATGSGDRTGLRPGMFVQFEADVEGDRKQRITGAITRLTVFTPAAQTNFGFLNDVGQPAGGGLDQVIGAYQGPGKYVICGKLIKVRGERVTVAIPSGRLEAIIAEDAVVDVHLANLAGAQPGDRIQIKGVQVAENKVFATEVKVALGSHRELQRNGGPAPRDGGGGPAPPERPPGPDPIGGPARGDAGEPAHAEGARPEVVAEAPPDPAEEDAAPRPDVPAPARTPKSKKDRIVKVN